MEELCVTSEKEEATPLTSILPAHWNVDGASAQAASLGHEVGKGQC